MRNDTANLRLIDVENIRYFRLVVLSIMVHLPNLNDLFSGKLWLWQIKSKTAFLNAIVRIVFTSAEKKMRGIATAWIVAFVEHAHSFRDLPVYKLPSHTVRHSGFLQRGAMAKSIAFVTQVFTPEHAGSFTIGLQFGSKPFGKHYEIMPQGGY